MLDQSYDRDIRFARQHLGRELAFIGHAIGIVFATLTRIQFDAPWRRQAQHRPESCG